ncbi:MAG: aminotransferase class I/II-fold pyridoxal phosphate-dependent enzyme [Selenomonadaceae bacterium]|nr:aminotransferase class I/II-fold pyridoxal phosphate-dependent enzyme [Selenomonadaceae bacterium]
MQAIILAAGMGRRLKELTRDNTKCMVKVNGVTLIDRMLHQLEKLHLSRIVIVVGYEGQKLIDFIATLGIQTPIVYVQNPIYDRTNNIYSLYLARDYLKREDTILLESDLIFDDELLTELIEDPRDSLALVDKYESWMDGTCLRLSDDDSILSFISKRDFRFDQVSEYFKTVNIYKFSQKFSATRYIPFLEAYSTSLGMNEYYEQVLRVIMILEDPGIRAKRLNHGERRWYEIDDEQDLDIAESIFAKTSEEKIKKIQRRYGGYWRYPGLLDFCYLVNPFFPPQRLIDEIQSNLQTLITNYPSGMEVNSLLASKNFGVHRENILVGNGAAELIKSLMSFIEGKIGIIRPTFEEYPNRYEKSETIEFCPSNQNFSYTAKDLIEFFDAHEISSLILINPDNPSGNFIDREDLLKLIDWTKSKNIRLILDESFVDFADENATLIDQKILDSNPNLIVMKSISKSYGIPGLRLGILASGDLDLISRMKRDVAIWNINSIGEFFMQIVEKYKSIYLESLKLLRAERDRFSQELNQIPSLRVIPSGANFVMVESQKISSSDIVRKLLIENKILLKDLSNKIDGNFLRISIRSCEDNNRLIEVLRSLLKEV